MSCANLGVANKNDVNYIRNKSKKYIINKLIHQNSEQQEQMEVFEKVEDLMEQFEDKLLPKITKKTLKTEVA